MSGIALLPGWTLRASADTDRDHQYRQIWTDDRDLRTLISEEQPTRYRVDFADLLSLEILPDTREIIRQDRVSHLPQSTFEHILADQVAPRILAHEGEFVIHAAAVQQGESALLFIGDSGSGKSTLAMSFGHVGWTLMGDDGVIVRHEHGRPVARAIAPSLRLFPDSIEELFAQPITGRPMAHYSTKQHISPATSRALAGLARPVLAIVLLTPPAGDSVEVRRMSGAQACMALIENSFALDPVDAALAKARLKMAGSVSRGVPAFSIQYPRDYKRLAAVREAVLSEVSDQRTAGQG